MIERDKDFKFQIHIIYNGCPEEDESGEYMIVGSCERLEDAQNIAQEIFNAIDASGTSDVDEVAVFDDSIDEKAFSLTRVDMHKKKECEEERAWHEWLNKWTEAWREVETKFKEIKKGREEETDGNEK